MSCDPTLEDLVDALTALMDEMADNNDRHGLTLEITEATEVVAYATLHLEGLAAIEAQS